MIHAFQDIMFDKKQHDLDKMRLLQANLHNLYIKVACRTNIIDWVSTIYSLLTAQIFASSDASRKRNITLFILVKYNHRMVSSSLPDMFLQRVSYNRSPHSVSRSVMIKRMLDGLDFVTVNKSKPGGTIGMIMLNFSWVV